MTSLWPADLRRYALAFAGWLVALGLTYVLGPYLVKTIFILFWPAVFVSAWYAGRGPAYLTIGLSVLAVGYFITAPTGLAFPVEPSDLVSLLFFLLLGAGVTELTTAFRRSRARAQVAEAAAAARAAELQDQAMELEMQAEELLRVNGGLQQSEARFRRLFDDNPMPMWLFDEESLQFLDVNNAAVRHYGYSRQEFLQMTLRDIRPASEVARLERAIADGVDAARDQRGTFRHRKKDGTLIDVAITAQQGEHDGRRARVVLAADVTERESLLRAERLARAVAEDANQAKTDFLATMSHELRTPLNAIAGYAELLEMGIHGPVTGDQRVALERIQRSQRHLLGLINDILNFAKLSAGRVEYDIADVMVRRAIDTLEPLVQPQIRFKQIRFSRDACADELKVRADDEKFGQILLNLLSNAIRFTNEQGAIAISCEARGDVVLIDVRDTGIGIPADRLGHIFEPFVQINRRLSAPHEGTGLGLAISRDLARAMGGDITVESELGVGSTFRVALPRA
jgi:PAS domain S-box-containing protein